MPSHWRFLFKNRRPSVPAGPADDPSRGWVGKRRFLEQHQIATHPLKFIGLARMHFHLSPWCKAIFRIFRFARLGATLFVPLLTGCATTAFVLTPAPQEPVCDPTATVLVLWTTRWRPDQKDVVEREKAAEAGMNHFFQDSGCFSRQEIRHVSSLNPAAVAFGLESTGGRFMRVVTIEIRELGPVVKLLTSAALVEGSTEVVLHVGVHSLQPEGQAREFSVSWRNGGPGVVKGVASLPSDLSAALRAGLQPTNFRR